MRKVLKPWLAGEKEGKVASALLRRGSLAVREREERVDSRRPALVVLSGRPIPREEKSVWLRRGWGEGCGCPSKAKEEKQRALTLK